MLIFMGAAAVVVAGLLVAGLVGGIYYFVRKSPSKPAAIQPAANIAPPATPTPTATPKPTPKRRRR
jgi:hypothetical protein